MVTLTRSRSRAAAQGQAQVVSTNSQQSMAHTVSPSASGAGLDVNASPAASSGPDSSPTRGVKRRRPTRDKHEDEDEEKASLGNKKMFRDRKRGGRPAAKLRPAAAQRDAAKKKKTGAVKQREENEDDEENSVSETKQSSRGALPDVSVTVAVTLPNATVGGVVADPTSSPLPENDSDSSWVTVSDMEMDADTDTDTDDKTNGSDWDGNLQSVPASRAPVPGMKSSPVSGDGKQSEASNIADPGNPARARAPDPNPEPALDPPATPDPDPADLGVATSGGDSTLKLSSIEKGGLCILYALGTIFGYRAATSMLSKS